MGIESAGSSALLDKEDDKPDERVFESEFTTAGVEAMDAVEDDNIQRKRAALRKLEELFDTPDIQTLRLPGEEEVFTEGYARLIDQLREEPKYQLNARGNIVPIAEDD